MADTTDNNTDEPEPDLPCQHCGKLKAEHIEVTSTVGGQPMLICPRNTYEPFDVN